MYSLVVFLHYIFSKQFKMSDSCVLHPVCKNSRCRKRTVLCVHNNGRFYWKCPKHGWSEWNSEHEWVPLERREMIEPVVLWEYEVMQPTNRQRVQTEDVPQPRPRNRSDVQDEDKQEAIEDEDKQNKIAFMYSCISSIH